MPRPNVVMFITDGHRAGALGCYGSDIAQTPHIDAFSQESARFRRAFCTHSVCMPTRASIFTGRYPHVHGVWANGIALPRDEVTLPQVLAEAGYATCATGKVHFEPQEPYEGRAPIIDTSEPYYGFREVHLSENAIGREYLGFIDREHPRLSQQARKRVDMPAEVHELRWITDQGIDFARRHAAGPAPFFLSCSFHELSPPCITPLEYAGHFDPAGVPVPDLREDDLAGRPPFYRQCYEGYLARGRQPDEPALRRLIAGYYDQLRFIDHQFGRLTEALRSLGLWDNTIVLFTADHGLSLNDHWQWRHGPFLFDEVTNIPMLWHAPGVTAAGANQALVEGVDIMPTVLELCGVETPAGVQGRSLVPLLRGAPGALGRESVLLQERRAPDLEVRGIDPDTVWQVALRTEQYKLTHYHDYPHGELYDLRQDPGEFVNLYSDPAYRSVRSDLEALLVERLVGSQDPLPGRHWAW